MFKMLTLLKSKVLLVALMGILVIGGTTAALAATDVLRQQGTHAPTLVHLSPTATARTGQRSDDDQEGDNDIDEQGQNCSNQEDLQDFLQHFHLAATKNSAAVQAVCALQAGTFKGTTPKGVAVSSTHTFRSGEIVQLFVLAQFLAMKDGVKLNDTNLASYLASAVHTCSAFSSTATCLKNTLPNMQPDHHDGD